MGSVYYYVFSINYSIVSLLCTENIWNRDTVNKKGLLHSTKHQNQLTALNSVAFLSATSAKPATDQLDLLQC